MALRRKCVCFVLARNGEQQSRLWLSHCDIGRVLSHFTQEIQQ